MEEVSGASATPTGLSQQAAEPEVSALRASIPSASELRIGHAAAQAYLDDPRHEVNLRTRQIMDQHFAMVHSQAVGMARDCFLNMIADATRFDEDIDGDEMNGRTVITVDYHLTVGHSQLEELANVLGITRGWQENIGDAIQRAIEAEPAQGIEAQRAETARLGSREPDPEGDAPNSSSPAPEEGK